MPAQLWERLEKARNRQKAKADESDELDVDEAKCTGESQMAEQWEYQTEVMKPDDMALRLTGLAASGWELVSLAPCEIRRNFWYPRVTTTTQYLAVLKRRMP